MVKTLPHFRRSVGAVEHKVAGVKHGSPRSTGDTRDIDWLIWGLVHDEPSVSCEAQSGIIGDWEGVAAGHPNHRYFWDSGEVTTNGVVGCLWVETEGV